MRTTILFGSIVLVALPCHGAVLTGWNFSGLTGGTGNWGASPLVASQMASGVSSSGLTRGHGVTTPFNVAVPSGCWGGTGFDGAGSAQQAALDGEYVSFSVTVASGKAAQFDSIGAYNVRRDANGPAYGQWQYQIDSGAFTDIGFIMIWGSNYSSAGNAQSAVSLGGISALQAVGPNSTVTFRLVSWGALSSSGQWFLNQTAVGGGLDLVLNGSVSPLVGPSPGAAGMLALAGLCVRRRRG
jgi:MYXO-CTERM domain-containing protein